MSSITVKEIAKMCGVSPSTVSNVLNGKNKASDETVKRIMDVIEETGFTPNYFASNIRKQKSKLIAIIVEDLNQFTTPPVVVATMATCEEMGYRAIVFNLRMYDRWKDTWFNDEEKLKSFLQPAINDSLSIKVDGIVYIAGHRREINCFPKDVKVPMVVAYATNKENVYPSIVIDDENAGYEVGKYFIEMGHKDIAVISGVETNMHSVLRISGFQKALFEAGILYNPKHTLYGNWDRESGYKLAPEIVKMGVKAVWCMNDQMAAGMYDYLYENNLEIGKDFSIIGCDNIEYAAYMYPRITTYELPLHEIGRRTAQMIFNIIENPEWKPEKECTNIQGTMIEGKSVKDMLG